MVANDGSPLVSDSILFDLVDEYKVATLGISPRLGLDLLSMFSITESIVQVPPGARHERLQAEMQSAAFEPQGDRDSRSSSQGGAV